MVYYHEEAPYQAACQVCRQPSLVHVGLMGADEVSEFYCGAHLVQAEDRRAELELIAAVQLG